MMALPGPPGGRGGGSGFLIVAANPLLPLEALVEPLKGEAADHEAAGTRGGGCCCCWSAAASPAATVLAEPHAVSAELLQNLTTASVGAVPPATAVLAVSQVALPSGLVPGVDHTAPPHFLWHCLQDSHIWGNSKDLLFADLGELFRVLQGCTMSCIASILLDSEKCGGVDVSLSTLSGCTFLPTVHAGTVSETPSGMIHPLYASIYAGTLTVFFKSIQYI